MEEQKEVVTVEIPKQENPIEIAKQEAKTDSVEVKPVKDPTQVRTIQQMAAEQGARIPKSLTPEQLRGQLLLDHHMGMTAVIPAFRTLSQRGKDRIFIAIMQLPHEGIETALNGKFEKQIYLAAQKALMAKHAIMFNRAKQEKLIEEAALAQKELLRKQKEKEAASAPQSESVEASKPQNAENSVETKPEVVDTGNVETPVTET